MEALMETAIGCDVGKAAIDVAYLGEADRHAKLRNEQHAIDRFVRGLPAGSLIGMEATGTYHEALADALARAGHRVFVINARWVHNYARSLGVRGKSDRRDAMVIARYVAAEHPHLKAHVPLTAEQRELRELLQQRHAVARLISQARQSLGDRAGPVIEQLVSFERELESRLKKAIAANPAWKSAFQRMRQVPGVGLLTAAQLLATLTRLPFANADAFIAHTGTDPRPNDSGQKRGRRRLSHHGDGTLRTLLFMAAMTACRDPRWRELYEAQRRKGLASTAAFIIIARKLARIAFSLFRSGLDYDPARLPAAAA
jgi:transposase